MQFDASNAVQVTEGGSPEDRPDWLVAAIDSGRVYWSGSYYTITAPGYVDQRARIGDWIVREDNGSLSAWIIAEPRCDCGASCQDIGGRRCRYTKPTDAHS